MSKGFKGFLIGLVTLISIFLAIWVGLSIGNKRNPADEIKSWFTTEVEESVETEDETLEDDVVEEETTEETQE